MMHGAHEISGLPNFIIRQQAVPSCHARVPDSVVDCDVTFLRGERDGIAPELRYPRIKIMGTPGTVAVNITMTPGAITTEQSHAGQQRALITRLYGVGKASASGCQRR